MIRVINITIFAVTIVLYTYLIAYVAVSKSVENESINTITKMTTLLSLIENKQYDDATKYATMLTTMALDTLKNDNFSFSNTKSLKYVIFTDKSHKICDLTFWKKSKDAELKNYFSNLCDKYNSKKKE